MANDLTRSELQRLKRRDWKALRESWLSHTAALPAPGVEMEASSQALLEAQGFSPPLDVVSRTEQLAGVRASVLGEAVKLYQKAKHTYVAATRLQDNGFETWSLFNHYHSAYLGAKGIMYLLGVTVPLLHSRQWILDVFPPPESDRSGKQIKPNQLTDFMAIPLAGLDQHQLWAWFQRVLSSTTSIPWETERGRQLYLISSSRDFPRRRNGLLYKPAAWIADDLLKLLPTEVARTEDFSLDPQSAVFLRSLNESVQDIFEDLIGDLADISAPIRRQRDASLILDVNHA